MKIIDKPNFDPHFFRIALCRPAKRDRKIAGHLSTTGCFPFRSGQTPSAGKTEITNVYNPKFRQ